MRGEASKETASPSLGDLGDLGDLGEVCILGVLTLLVFNFHTEPKIDGWNDFEAEDEDSLD